MRKAWVALIECATTAIWLFVTSSVFPHFMIGISWLKFLILLFQSGPANNGHVINNGPMMNNGPVGPKGLRSGGFKSNTAGLHDNFVGNMAQLSISTNKVMYCWLCCWKTSENVTSFSLLLNNPSNLDYFSLVMWSYWSFSFQHFHVLKYLLFTHAHKILTVFVFIYDNNYLIFCKFNFWLCMIYIL